MCIFGTCRRKAKFPPPSVSMKSCSFRIYFNCKDCKVYRIRDYSDAGVVITCLNQPSSGHMAASIGPNFPGPLALPLSLRERR